LLKSHWKRGDKTRKKIGPEPPDLVDLELASSRKSLHPSDKFLIEVDSERSARIRLYRGVSSLVVYSMIFCLLYFSSKLVDDVVSDMRAQNESNRENEDAAIVKRKMTTNLTSDEYMSSLTYDKFLEKVEEQILNRKRGRMIAAWKNSTSVHQNTDAVSNANTRGNTVKNNGSKPPTPGSKVSLQHALSLGKVFQKKKEPLPPTSVGPSQKLDKATPLVANQVSLLQTPQLTNMMVGVPNSNIVAPLQQPLPAFTPLTAQFSFQSPGVVPQQQQLGNNNQFSLLGLTG
jgi:hypothetical protein